MASPDDPHDPTAGPPELPPLAPRDRADGLPTLPGGGSASRPAALPPLVDEPAPEEEPLAPAPPPRRPRRRRGVAPAILLGAVVIAAGAVGAASYALISNDDDPAAVATAPAADPARQAAAAELSLQQAISLTEPSVVGVRVPGGQGSGVIVWPNNLIVTNFHVVSGGRAGAEAVGAALPDSVTVVTADDRRLSARIVASDARADLVILEPVSDTGLGGVRLVEGPDAGLVQGDQVFAIGTPFGLQNTVTAGIVSAVGRVNPEGIPTIQTDAPINPGNSGGGLFDLNGRLVGIPTSIGSPIPGNVGIGFAVPANRVAQLLETVS